MEIDRTSRRILGSLLEKRWTTPEQYPLTVNALVLACNQKSNRDPEMNIDQAFVEGCLYQLRLADLAMVVERDTGRAVRYAERMSERLGLSRQEQSVIAELFLRGPQTAGELLRRCERMAHFENEGEVENVLRALAEKRWAELMPRESGQRHARWRHLFTPADEAPHAPVPIPEMPNVVPVQPAPPGPPLLSREQRDELAELRAEVAALRAEVKTLHDKLAHLGGLNITP